MDLKRVKEKKNVRKMLKRLRKRIKNENDIEHELALVSAALLTTATGLNTPQVSCAFKSLKKKKASHTALQKLECVLWDRRDVFASPVLFLARRPPNCCAGG